MTGSGEWSVRRLVDSLLHSQAVALLLRGLLGGELPSYEDKRRSPRHTLSTPVVVAPLDQQARPLGVAQQVTLVDVSIDGAGLLGKADLDCPLLLVDYAMSGVPGVQTLARVVWSKECDGYTRVGCEFLHQPDLSLPLV